MSAYFKFEGELRLALRAEMQGEEVRHISHPGVYGREMTSCCRTGLDRDFV